MHFGGVVLLFAGVALCGEAWTAEWSCETLPPERETIDKSESGRVIGPWNQQDRPLFAENGGHGMIFRSLDGRLLCAFHQPNSGERERLKLIELIDNGDTLAVKN